MPEFIGALIYDSSINLAGLERDKREAINKFHSIGREATRTFENEIARSLAKSVRPEVFAGDLAKSRALLQGFGDDATKIFDRALGRQAARRMFQPFIDETKTLTGQLKGILATNFSPRNLLLGVAGGIGLERIGTELVNFGKDAVVFAADFETSLTKIRTIADRGTDIDEIGERLQVLSTKIPQDLLTLSEGLFNIIGSGISDSAEALKVLDVAARAATAGFTDTKFAADAIVFAINAFGKSAEDAEEIANILFKTVDVGKIEFKDLATNIGEVANPAAIAGVSLQELGQAIATITLGGTPVSETFTALKNFLQSIIAPTEGARKAAEEFGLEFSKAGIAAAGGLEQFIQKVREATGGDTQKLDRLFPEARALRAAQILTNTLADTYVRLGNEFSNTSRRSGEMQKALEDVNDSATAQAKIFTNNLKLATLELGKGFLEVLKPALKAVNQGFIESENAAGKYVKSVIGLTKLLGNPQLAALLGFGAIIKGGQPQSNIPVLDEVEVIAERVQAVSDGVETLSSAAEFTADSFERAAAALEEMARIKLPDYLTKSKPNFEFGKIRGANNSTLSDAQFKRELEVLLNIKLTPALKLDTKKIIGVEKITNDLRDALSDIGFPFKSFLIDLEKNHIATESELVQLADLINRGFGDVFNALFEFVDKATDPHGTILGQLLAGSNFFITAFTQAQSFVDSAFRSLFGASDLNKRVQDEVDRINSAREAEVQRSQDLIDALKDVEEALKGPTVSAGTLIKTLEDITSGITEVSGLTRNQINTIFDALKGQNFKPATTLQEFIDQLTFLSAQKPELLPIITLLQSIKDPNLKQALTLLFGQFPGVLDAISKFGSEIGNQFDVLVRNLNSRFSLTGIDDPLKKLDLLAKGIRDKFKAIIPTTDSGIRDLIAKGLEALEAGGQTLLDFLALMNLEELSPDELRDLLELLNNLANEAKNKVDGIDDATTRVALIRSITFEQGNRLLDENTTMRILQTNMVDIQMQMLSIMKDSLRGGLSSAALSRGGAANIFIMRDGNVRRASSSELTELERLQADRFLAEAKGMGLA